MSFSLLHEAHAHDTQKAVWPFFLLVHAHLSDSWPTWTNRSLASYACYYRQRAPASLLPGPAWGSRHLVLCVWVGSRLDDPNLSVHNWVGGSAYEHVVWVNDPGAQPSTTMRITNSQWLGMYTVPLLCSLSTTNKLLKYYTWLLIHVAL